MRKWVIVGASAGLTLAVAGAAGFLASQGLVRASLWAVVLGLPIAVVAAAAGVWATVLTVKPSRGESVPGPSGKLGAPDNAPPAGMRSGSIRQEGTRGTAVAHTGSGDICIGKVPAREPPDEPC